MMSRDLGASASQTGLSSLRDDADKSSSPKASIPSAGRPQPAAHISSEIKHLFEHHRLTPAGGRRGCERCNFGEYYPQYGVAPHECFWRKGPEFTIGQSTLLPIEQWGDPFVPDLADGETWADFVYPRACGVFYCPDCKAGYQADWDLLVARIGPPPASGMSAFGRDGNRLGSGGPPARPEGDAQNNARSDQ